MDIILIAGLWLPSTAWADVAAELERLGHHPHPVELPGVDDGRTSATLDDQLAAVLAAVDRTGRPVVVGHSAASTLAWLAADRRPTALAAAVLIGGFLTAAGHPYAPFFPVEDGVMAFPGWEPFEGPDSDDLDPAARSAIEAMAVPVTAGVAAATVELGDERRFAVPVRLVCPEYSPDQARAWLAAGDLPELERVEDLGYLDIDSGHWPMVSRPGELARLLDGLTREL